MSAQTNISNDTLIYEQSTQALKSLKIAFICWLLVGLLTFISNLLAVLTIAKSKTLRSKYYYSLASLTTSGCLCGLTYIYQGGKKTYLALAGLPEASPRISCLLGFAPLLWSTGLSDCLTFALNVDRFLALAVPIAYKQRLDKAYVVILNSACWMVPSIFWAFSFKLENPTQMVSLCVGSTAPEPWFARLFTNMRWVGVAPNLTLFAVTLIILKMRLDKTKSMGATERRAAREGMELGMIKTMGVIIGLYIILKLGGYAILTVVVLVFEGPLQSQVNSFTGMLPGIYAGSHFWLYLIMSKDFRKSFKGLVRRQKIAKVGTVFVSTAQSRMDAC